MAHACIFQCGAQLSSTTALRAHIRRRPQSCLLQGVKDDNWGATAKAYIGRYAESTPPQSIPYPLARRPQQAPSPAREMQQAMVQHRVEANRSTATASTTVSVTTLPDGTVTNTQRSEMSVSQENVRVFHQARYRFERVGAHTRYIDTSTAALCTLATRAEKDPKFFVTDLLSREGYCALLRGHSDQPLANFPNLLAPAVHAGWKDEFERKEARLLEVEREAFVRARQWMEHGSDMKLAAPHWGVTPTPRPSRWCSAEQNATLSADQMEFIRRKQEDFAALEKGTALEAERERLWKGFKERQRDPPWMDANEGWRYFQNGREHLDMEPDDVEQELRDRQSRFRALTLQLKRGPEGSEAHCASLGRVVTDRILAWALRGPGEEPEELPRLLATPRLTWPHAWTRHQELPVTCRFDFGPRLTFECPMDARVLILWADYRRKLLDGLEDIGADAKAAAAADPGALPPCFHGEEEKLATQRAQEEREEALERRGEAVLQRIAEGPQSLSALAAAPPPRSAAFYAIETGTNRKKRRGNP